MRKPMNDSLQDLHPFGPAVRVSPTVQSWNEWDLLKEVIVGRVEGAHFADEDPRMIKACVPEKHWDTFIKYGGSSFPQAQIELAQRDLERFSYILNQEGVTVRRPDNPGKLFTYPVQTEHWRTRGGSYVAMPRDNLLVVGNKIIEAPMAWRSRYLEGVPYETLRREYTEAGAEWIQAPRPKLLDNTYKEGWQPSDTEFNSVINNHEPLFDAADFTRLGLDIIGQLSHVTNEKGVEWLQSVVGPEVKVHIFQFNDSHPMHIDATFCPLRPGLVLINPERVLSKQIQELKQTLFKGWDFVFAPKPIIPDSHPLFMTSKWINMNILMLDEERVMIEALDEPMFKFMKSIGLKPIPCPFLNFNTFGGSFHCATADVRREGEAQRYISKI